LGKAVTEFSVFRRSFAKSILIPEIVVQTSTSPREDTKGGVQL
jgi:hypothetical protein